MGDIAYTMTKYIMLSNLASSTTANCKCKRIHVTSMQDQGTWQKITI